MVRGVGERIPTTEDIRNWATWVPDTTVGMKVSQQAEVEFDAWLAAHDREVEARVLREAADAVENDEVGASPSIRTLVGSIDGALKVGAWLRARADRIASH